MATLELTDIKPTKKGRFALFCSTGFLFSIDDLTLHAFHLKIGDQLDDATLACIRQRSDAQKAYVKALDFLALRDHSEKELYDKLLRTFDEDTACAAINKMREIDYVNDMRFAQKFAAEAIGRKRASKRDVQSKLYQKGIDRDIAETVLAAYDGDETIQIRSIIEKKYLLRLREPNEIDKIFAALVRKGFSARDIRAVLRNWGGDETDWIGED